ncbi:MAG: threonine-phosphate decarboxylase [Gammaproteobacteria bacterium]|nr:threonine-phosphate decarboxylase [Gammaproteobacteria bacterium]
MKILHGGNLERAEKEFGIEKNTWLDLSTGINPCGYPVPQFPAELIRRLPSQELALESAATSYYQTNSLLAIPGSQFAIQTLPALFPKCCIAIPRIGYQEHKVAWEKSEHDIFLYSDDKLDELEASIVAGKVNIVLIINPNNPSCLLIEKTRLKFWLDELEKRNAFLIIDETFMDSSPEHSMAEYLNSSNLVILRSLGKFFGLAGVRLGFLLANKEICETMQEKLGPWAVSGPAQWIGIQALTDTAWQKNNRLYLENESASLTGYLGRILASELIEINNTALFVSLILKKDLATSLYKNLAHQGVLIRQIDYDTRHSILRFGLPGNDEQWSRLKSAIKLFLETRYS